MDSWLIRRARQGDEAAFERLTERHADLLDFEASRYRPPPGSTRADLRQAALIGFDQAVRDYDGRPFRPFARLCANRKVITAVKAATRGKHRPLNDAEALDAPIPGTEDLTRAEVTPAPGGDAATILDDRALVAGLPGMLARLSEVEREALVGVTLDDRSYVEIAERFGCGEKAVDNAIQRARAKLAEAPSPPVFVVRLAVDHPRVARRVNEILGQAEAELQDREGRLLEIQSQTKAELDEVRGALRRLSGGGKAKAKGRAKPEPGANGSAPARDADLPNKIVAALKGSLEPLTAGQIADQLGGLHPAGIGASLRRLEADGKVVRVDTGDDKRRWGISQLGEGIRRAEVAVAMDPAPMPT